jgi:hypothetical protein
MGYRIQACDGPVGQVADVLIDGESKTVPRLVVATSRWRPGRKVTVSTKHVQAISGTNKRVFLNISCRAVRTGPRYDPSAHEL